MSASETQQAHDTAARSQAICDSMLLVEFDRSGIILWANDNYLRCFGYTAEALIGKPRSILCTPKIAAHPEYHQAWERTVRGEAVSGEFLRKSADGRDVYLRGSVTHTRDADGEVRSIILVASDVTAAKLRALEYQGKIEALSRSQGMIEMDLQGKVLEVNDNFLHMMGYLRDEVLGQHHSMFVPPEEVNSPTYQEFWQKLSQGEFDEGEYLRLGKGGRHVWLHATNHPILNLEGKPIKVVKYCVDITARKEHDLMNQVRHQAMLKSVCYMELDDKGTILDVNDLFCQAIGYRNSELIGQNGAFLAFKEDIGPSGYTQAWQELRDKLTTTGDFRRKGRDDREVWFSATGSGARTINGQRGRYFLIGKDITQERMAKQELDGKLGAIDRSQAVIEFDMQGQVLHANQNFLQLMGYSLEEIRSRHHRTFVEPAHAASLEYQAFWERLARGEFESGEYKRIGRDGREVWIQATYNAILDPSGRPVKVVKIASDVTAQKLRNADYQAKVNAIDKGQAVIEFDLDGNVLNANRNFLAAMGYTLREIQGQHHSIFCTAEYTHTPEYRDFWLRLSEGEFMTGRFQRMGKFGREVWIQATYNPLLDLNGKVVKIVKYAYDVTKEVQLERHVSQRSNEMSRSVQQLIESITHIAANSGVAAELAQETNVAARSGHDSLQKSIAAIDNIQASSVQMAEIVRVIGDIAGQTNLLAFNAAIEAARAGQHGVGFSVVAGEVRKLAERSSQAAREISKLIDESTQHVNQGAQVTKAAASSFEGILAAVTRTGNSVSAIASATDAQRNMAEAVTSTIQQLEQLKGS